MISGQMPERQKVADHAEAASGHRQKPDKVNTLVGSGADRSLIQPKNGACRISIVTNSTLYSAKNTGIWISIGRQPETGLILLALVQRHGLLLLLHLVVGIFFPQRGDLRRDRLIFAIDM